VFSENDEPAGASRVIVDGSSSASPVSPASFVSASKVSGLVAVKVAVREAFVAPPASELTVRDG
jgi:hypothetical protein